MKMNFKPLLASLVIGTVVMSSSVAVSAGGAAQIVDYTGKVDGGTVKISIMGGVILDDTDVLPDGICGYEGNPINLKIPREIEITPVNPNPLYFYQEKMTRPDILAGAFKDCDSLKTIEFTSNSIKTDAVTDCDNLECVTFKDSESEYGGRINTCRIEEGAFKNCKALKKVVISNEVYINENAFVNCPIETVVLPEKYDKYVKPVPIKNDDGTERVSLNNTYHMLSLAGFTELKNVNIPYGTYSLNGTFNNCTSLESIEIPETVGSISNAFQNCTSLTEVKIMGNETKFSKTNFENSNPTIVCNPESKAAELCKEYNINCVDFNGNVIYSTTDETKSKVSTETKADNSEIKVILNGKSLAFSQPPVIENGTTLVPMRAIFEAMEASVEWNGETKSITAVKDDITINLTLNETKAAVNNNEITLAVPAKLVNGNTMVPLRFISESLGSEVNWDGEDRTITINSK